MSEWNKTSDGYPTHEKPVLVSNGQDVFAALATYVVADESEGWLWEVLDWSSHLALNEIESYICDDDYEFDYWTDLPAPPKDDCS